MTVINKLIALTGLSLLSTSIFASAAVITSPPASSPYWQGSADYNTGGANDPNMIVSNFDSYDFGAGALLIKNFDFNSTQVGSTIHGYYQTYVNSHLLNGAGVPSSGLNTTGSGAGYELTATAEFMAEVTSVTSFGITFGNVTGTTSLYLDDTPDYSFANDSGFDDGIALLTSDNLSGNGIVASFGFGSTQTELSFDPMDVKQNVYDPDTITGAIATFALDAANLTVLSGITSVNGQPVTANDVLFAADGNLQLLSEVPLPLPAWLFGVALIGWTYSAKKKAT